MTGDYFTEHGMRRLGVAREFAGELHQLIGRITVLEDFTLNEIDVLGTYMPVYEADPATPLIVEGDPGDFMILLLSGSVDVSRKDRSGTPSRIAVVQAGHTLGEMSMIDGEPRFSSCTTLEHTRFAVLTRDSLTEVIRAQSGIGAKILVKLVHMLAQRLRNTSMKLVRVSEA
ncbi:MAG: cyclic nucleotide-binding domain-containing protein [Methylobacterium sp.]|nr:cyclic nucleotide-binding domain-containing protein [Methylobacterium sp.]